MPSRGEGVFHYSFSAPLQTVTEIMKNKDGSVLGSAAWRWALCGQESRHGPALCQPPGAVLGSQSRQDVACQAPAGGKCPARDCLSLLVGSWAAGGRGSGGPAIPLLYRGSKGLSLTPACKAHLSLAQIHKGSCGSGVSGPRTARAPAPLCPVPSGRSVHHGAAAPSATASLVRVFFMEEYREEPTARHLPPLCASHGVEGQPKMPI